MFSDLISRSTKNLDKYVQIHIVSRFLEAGSSTHKLTFYKYEHCTPDHFAEIGLQARNANPTNVFRLCPPLKNQSVLIYDEFYQLNKFGSNFSYYDTLRLYVTKCKPRD